MLKKTFKNFSAFFIGFILTLQAVFANSIIESIRDGASFADVVTNIEALDWITYLALLLIIFSTLDKYLSNSFGRSSKVISAFVAFMSVTGFMFILANNNIFPMYIMLLAGQLLVLAVSVGILFKARELLEGTKFEKFGFGIAILLVLSLLHIFNGMIVGPGGTVQSYLQNEVTNDSIIANVANFFYFESLSGAGGFWFGLLVVIIALFSLKGSSADVNVFDTKKWRQNIEKKKEILKERKDLTFQLNELYQALGRARK